MSLLRCVFVFTFVASLAACKGGQSDAGGDASSSSSVKAAPPAQPSALAAATPPAAPKSPRLSKQECAQLFDHVVDLAVNEGLKDEKMTAAQRKQATKEARKIVLDEPEMKNFDKECNEMYTRVDFDCYMKATSQKMVDACDRN